jgi:hypothetical protein
MRGTRRLARTVNRRPLDRETAPAFGSP